MGIPRTPEWETLRHIRESSNMEDGSNMDTASDSDKVKLTAIERIKAAKNKCSVIADAEHSEDVATGDDAAYIYKDCTVSLMGGAAAPSGGDVAPSEQSPEKPPLSLGDLLAEAKEAMQAKASRPSPSTPPVKPGFDPSPTRETSYTRTPQQAAPLTTPTPDHSMTSEVTPPQPETPPPACEPPLFPFEDSVSRDWLELPLPIPREGAVREMRDEWNAIRNPLPLTPYPPESPKGAGCSRFRLVELPNGTLVNPAHVICVEGGGLQHRQGTLDAVVVRLSGGAAGGFGGGPCDQRFEVPWTHPTDGRALTTEERAAIAEGIRQQILAALTSP